ncbi:MAG: M23 family metallopeptidase [Candidatus Latescibacteria bacterium]|jgi:murein DD-endopeptidase MepM/ murein hydrolase activator NlpD|nr:M23 family metallopeptidase [Candidatus Latescibacterota bacterium]
MRFYNYRSPSVDADSVQRPIRLRPGRVLLVLLLLSAGAFLWSTRAHPPARDTQPSPLAESSHPVPADTTVVDSSLEESRAEGILIDGRILRGEVFSEALERRGISRAEIFELVTAVRKGVHRSEFNPNIVQRGDRYLVEVDDQGTIQRFEYAKKGSRETRFVADRRDGILHAWKEEVPLDREVVVISDRIDGSIWASLDRAGESPDILSAKLTDIFEYYIDFTVDCRPGDRFGMAVEKFYKEGEFVRYGDILAAEYRAARKSHQAFLYEAENGDAGYFDTDGRSLQGLFLKSPLNYRRISSRFTSRRYHPVLKKYTPHHGIDYAANYGAPVWATADGIVTFKGRKGALGNYIEIKHKNGYKSGYGHLSRFRRGLRKGSRVKQKQTIGYVGATGRATGPHLHYNFHVLEGGRYRARDAARVVHKPTGKPVAMARMLHYFSHRDRLTAVLDRQPGSVVTAFLDAGSAAGTAE